MDERREKYNFDSSNKKNFQLLLFFIKMYVRATFANNIISLTINEYIWFAGAIDSVVSEGRVMRKCLRENSTQNLT